MVNVVEASEFSVCVNNQTVATKPILKKLVLPISCASKKYDEYDLSCTCGPEPFAALPCSISSAWWYACEEDVLTKAILQHGRGNFTLRCARRVAKEFHHFMAVQSFRHCALAGTFDHEVRRDRKSVFVLHQTTWMRSEIIFIGRDNQGISYDFKYTGI